MQGQAEQGMGLNFRRRVVYRALTLCFADEALARRCFTLWNREYAARPHMALAGYVSAVARELGLDAAARRRLQRALHEGLALRYEQLARVPDHWMPAANQTGEFPALPAVDAPAARAPVEAPSRARAPAAGKGPAPARASAAAPAVEAAPAPPQPTIERADRCVFRVMAEPLAAMVLEETDPHPGLLAIALEDLARTLDGGEHAAHARLTAWAAARFLDRDLPVMADIDGYRHLFSLLRRLVADLSGEAVADRLVAASLVRADRLPQARLCPPLLLL